MHPDVVSWMLNGPVPCGGIHIRGRRAYHEGDLIPYTENARKGRKLTIVAGIVKRLTQLF